MAEIPELLEFVETKTDLKVIAVTEHDSLDGAELVYDAWARGRYSFEVVIGEEVTTLDGHLLALWVERPVRSFQPLRRTLEAIHTQGGLAVIPHPFSWVTRSLGERAIAKVQRTGTDGVYFDGLEVCNGSWGGALGKAKALRLNREAYQLTETGGSDAHFLDAVGSSYTVFPGSSAGDLRRAIEQGTTHAFDGPRVRLRDIGIKQLLHQQARGLMVTPRNVVARPIARRVRDWWG
jgi:predicted metal-dependent phosphoesterase TrpH